MKKVLFVMIILIMYACDNKSSYYYTFSDKELLAEYYPYNEGEYVRFVNESSDTITFIVDKISEDLFLCDSKYDGLSTASYHYVLECPMEYMIELCVESISAELDKGTNTFMVKFYLNGEVSLFSRMIYGDEKNCLNILDDSIVYEYNTDNEIKDLIHVKNIGIQSFYDSVNDNRWTLLNE